MSEKQFIVGSKSEEESMKTLGLWREEKKRRRDSQYSEVFWEDEIVDFGVGGGGTHWLRPRSLEYHRLL